MKGSLSFDIDLSDGLDVDTTPLSTKRAIDAAQSGPNTSSVTGPLIYNQIAINNNCKPTGDKRTMGLYMQVNSGGNNEEGGVYSAFFNMNHNAPSNPAGDHTALAAQAVSSVADGGTGEIYGLNSACYALSGCTTPGVNGGEFDVKIDSGATVTRRSGVRVVNEGNAVASGHDAAFAAMSTTLGGGFKTGLLFSTHFTQAPLQPTGDVIGFDGAQTVCNVVNLTDLTVTGHILKSANFKVSGSGAIDMKGALTLSAAIPEIVLFESDGATNAKYWDLYVNNGVLKLDVLNDSFGGRTNLLTIPRARISITGSRSSGAALLSLIAALCQLLPLTDETTA